jgi:hypothetical protein
MADNVPSCREVLSRILARKVRFLRANLADAHQKQQSGNQAGADAILSREVIPVLVDAIEALSLRLVLQELTSSERPREDEIREFADHHRVSNEEINQCLEDQRHASELHQRLVDHLAATATITEPLDFDLLAAIIKICAATVVGAFIGAPIGAFLVKEDVVHEMVKAAVASGTGAIIAVGTENVLDGRRPARNVTSPNSDPDTDNILKPLFESSDLGFLGSIPKPGATPSQSDGEPHRPHPELGGPAGP